MTGISEIAQGDAPEEQPPVIPPRMAIEELDPWDQQMMRIWEKTEPALDPWSIDPIVRWREERKRKKK